MKAITYHKPTWKPSTMKDNQNLEVTCNEAEALHAIDASINILFRQRAGIEQWLPNMADTYPLCPMLQVYAAVTVFMSFSTRIIDTCLSIYLSRLALSTLNEREQYHSIALKKLATHDFYLATYDYQILLEKYPQDKIALLMLTNCAFLAGTMQPLLDTYESINPYYRDDPNFLSMQAFLYAHIHRQDEAKSLIEKSLTYEPHNAWTQHVYIHTLNENNLAEVETAIDFLERHSKDWPKQNRFFEGHNWMHLCLLYLNKDRLLASSSSATAAFILDRYTKHIWGETKPYRFQNNAFLILWHLALTGHTEQILKEHWHDLAHHAEPFMDEYLTPYLTMTAILAVATVAPAKADVALVRFAAYATSHPLNSEKRHAWYEIGLPVLEGCLAYLKKDYASAVRLLTPVHDKTRAMGHSDEQRAIVTATYALAKRLS